MLKLLKASGPQANIKLMQKEKRKNLHQFMNNIGMSENDLKILDLLYKKSLNQPQAAEVCGTTRGGINNVEKRAMAKINERIEEAKAAQNTSIEEKTRIKSEMLKNLTQKERQVVRLKLGFYDPYGNTLSFDELGKETAMTLATARTCYMKSLKKMEAAAGITEQDLKNCRDLSGVIKMIESA